MTERLQSKISLRKFAKPKPVQRKSRQSNDHEIPARPTPTNQNDQNLPLNQLTPTSQSKAQMTQNHQSTAENFESIYKDLDSAASYSGDLKAIANKIPSYRYN